MYAVTFAALVQQSVKNIMMKTARDVPKPVQFVQKNAGRWQRSN